MCLELYFEGSLLITLVSDVTSCLGYFTASRHDRNTRLIMNSFPDASCRLGYVCIGSRVKSAASHVWQRRPTWRLGFMVLLLCSVHGLAAQTQVTSELLENLGCKPALCNSDTPPRWSSRIVSPAGQLQLWPTYSRLNFGLDFHNAVKTLTRTTVTEKPQQISQVPKTGRKNNKGTCQRIKHPRSLWLLLHLL